LRLLFDLRVSLDFLLARFFRPSWKQNKLFVNRLVELSSLFRTTLLARTLLPRLLTCPFLPAFLRNWTSCSL